MRGGENGHTWTFKRILNRFLYIYDVEVFLFFFLQCFLSCHKRCLETLTIQCGHKKLQGRLQLFGREFSQVASSTNDGIPFIITKCISEIERRALTMKVGTTHVRTFITTKIKLKPCANHWSLFWSCRAFTESTV